MAIIAEAVRHLIEAGVSGDALVQAIADMEAAELPQRTARQERNRRYYEKKASEKRLKASETSESTLLPNGVPLDGFPTPLPLTPLPLPSSHKENTPKGVQKKKPKVEIPAWMPMQDWNDWIEMRERKRAKPTNRALEITIKKLTEWKAKGHDPGAILQTSIERGYTGVFEPKPELARQTRYPAEPKRNVTNLMETR